MAPPISYIFKNLTYFDNLPRELKWHTTQALVLSCHVCLIRIPGGPRHTAFKAWFLRHTVPSSHVPRHHFASSNTRVTLSNNQITNPSKLQLDHYNLLTWIYAFLSDFTLKLCPKFITPACCFPAAAISLSWWGVIVIAFLDEEHWLVPILYLSTIMSLTTA